MLLWMLIAATYKANLRMRNHVILKIVTGLHRSSVHYSWINGDAFMIERTVSKTRMNSLGSLKRS